MKGYNKSKVSSPTVNKMIEKCKVSGEPVSRANMAANHKPGQKTKTA